MTSPQTSASGNAVSHIDEILSTPAKKDPLVCKLYAERVSYEKFFPEFVLESFELFG